MKKYIQQQSFYLIKQTETKMNYFKRTGQGKEAAHQGKPAQSLAAPQSKQRALESDSSRASQNELERQPHDKAGPRKPPQGNQRRSGSRKRSKRAHFAEQNPEPSDHEQIAEQLNEENGGTSGKRLLLEKNDGFGEEVEATKQNELAAEARPQNEQFQYQAYVRQTWDISRFINADGSPQFEALMKAPGQSREGREPPEFRQPAIGKYWEEFNDFYIAFIQDIDYYYKIKDAKRPPEKAERRSNAPESDPDEEQVPPQILHVRQQLAKYNQQITNVPEISQNILGIIRTLKEEDKMEMLRLKNQRNGLEPVDVAAHGAMGENLEYFIENRVIETLAAYAMTDQPEGFFKFLLGAIEDLISSVSKQNNILSHISVNQSIRQILKTIYDKLLEIPFTDSNTQKARRPDAQFVLRQRPRVIFYTIDILKFIYTLTFKVQNEVHLIRLLFCKKDGLLNRYGQVDDSLQELTSHEQNMQMRLLELRQYQQQNDPSSGTGVLIQPPAFSAGGASPIRNQNIMDDIVSYDVCLPFHILVYYLKNAKCMLSECEKNFLDDVIVMSFNSLCIDAKFVCYLINESDFIEIVMSEIATCLSTLPQKLSPLDDLGHFNTIKQLENMNPLLLNEQLQDLVTSCKLLNQIFETLDLQAKRIFERRIKKDDGLGHMQCIGEIQKAFLQEYVQIVLINTIQGKLLAGSSFLGGGGGGAQVLNCSGLNDLANSSTSDMEQMRTIAQYLVEILDAVQAKPFALVTFAFLNGCLSTNLDRYLSDVLQESRHATAGGGPTPGLGGKPNERYDYQHRDKSNLQIIDELNREARGSMSHSEGSYGQGVGHASRQDPGSILNEQSYGKSTINDYDAEAMVQRLYPQRQTASRFSLLNPNARFTQTHDILRKTIKEYRELGKVPDIALEDLDEQDGFGYRAVNQKEILAAGGLYASVAAGSLRGLGTAMLFQKQGVSTGSGAPSSNLFACEGLVNQTLSESLATHNNIDLLFTKAQNIEAQAKLEDDFVKQLQVRQFENVTYHGMMPEEMRLHVHSLVFRSQNDVSMVMLKLFSELIKGCGISHFIKENFKVEQTIFRISDDIARFNDKYRLILPITSEQRQQSLVDFPEIIFKALDHSPLSAEYVRNLEKLGLCMGLLSHQLIHRQLIQLYFSEEYTIRLMLKLNKQVNGPQQPYSQQGASKTGQSSVLAAAGVGGTGSGSENKIKELRLQLHSTPSTNSTTNMRGGTGGSTGDTGGISDFEQGLHRSSPLRGQKAAAAASESSDASKTKAKQPVKTSNRPGSPSGILSGLPGLPGKAQIQDNKQFLHIWEMLLQKLLQFMDNTPNENALLCQIFLQLFEIPGEEQLQVKRRPRVQRKTAEDKKVTFDTMPLELLQWWLFAIEFDTKIPNKISQRQQKQIDEFKQSFGALRKKYGQSSKSTKKVWRAAPLNMSNISSNQSSQRKGSSHYHHEQVHSKFNIMAALSKVKSHVELYEDDEKVCMYKQVLQEELRNQASEQSKRKGRMKRQAATTSTAAKGALSTAAPDQQADQRSGQALNTQEQQTKDAREKQRQKLADELKQPYIFRDRNLISAENCLLFNDFYEKLWQQFSIISLAIHQINSCGPSTQDSLYEREFCQEGSIVCRSQEQRETLVRRDEARIDIWNGQIDNINKSILKERDSAVTSYQSCDLQPRSSYRNSTLSKQSIWNND